MTEDEKKKKKGVAIVIAVTPHAPKKPEDTSKPDEKMEKAWKFLKEELDPRVTGGVPAKSLKDNPGKLERILGDLEEGRDFGRQIAGKPTQTDYEDMMSHFEMDPEADSGRIEIPNTPSEIPVEDPMDDVREEEEREEKLGEGVDGPKDFKESELMAFLDSLSGGPFDPTTPEGRNSRFDREQDVQTRGHPKNYDDNPKNPFSPAN